MSHLVYVQSCDKCYLAASQVSFLILGMSGPHSCVYKENFNVHNLLNDLQNPSLLAILSVKEVN